MENQKPKLEIINDEYFSKKLETIHSSIDKNELLNRACRKQLSHMVEQLINKAYADQPIGVRMIMMRPFSTRINLLRTQTETLRHATREEQLTLNDWKNWNRKTQVPK